MEVLASRIILHPRSLEASTTFYRDVLGLHLYREFGPAEARSSVFFLGGGFLELTGSSGVGPSSATQLWLQVRDLDGLHRDLLQQNVAIDEAPTLKPWGLREMRACDPDGLILVFVEVPQDHPLRTDTRTALG